MNSNTVEHKLNVFLSSKCGGKYSIMRKALKHLLVETGLTEVYCFETEPGSSESMPSAYLDYIDTSQLFVLIVDNKDNITAATLSEYKRAKELGKRILAIFCNEDSKEKTEIEKEIIEQGLCKYDTASSFSDIAVLTYKAVIQDLVAVYKKKKEKSQTVSETENAEKDSSNNEVAERDTSALSTITGNVFVEKSMLTGFDNVQKTIVNTVFRDIGNITDSTELDNLTCSFLQVVLCNAKFDSVQFSLLKNLVIEKHADALKRVIDMRLDAVQFYFSGDLESCISKLTEILQIALSDSSIPKWICNDIAIDLRNMINTKSNINGTISIYNEGQKIIDESEEFLYFPAIDRLASDIKETAIKEYNKVYLQSPYTVSLGGVDSLFKDIAPYFCTALLFGSITHIKIVKNLLADVLQALRQEYSDSEFNSELIKLSILQFDDKTLENVVRTFNQPYSIISSTEIQKIIDAIDNLPLQYEQVRAKLLLLKHFGNYFSDEQFAISLEWLSGYLESLKKENAKKAFSNNEIIKKLFINNHRRIPESIFFDYVKWLFSYKSVLSISTACELIRYLPFYKISKKAQIELRKLIREVIDRDSGMPHLHQAILAFCVNTSVDISSLESSIKNKMSSFYEGDYYLEMYVKDKKSSMPQIHKQMKAVKSRIEVQGKNGFIGFADNPFATIKNIIVFNHLDLSKKEQSEIAQTTCEFLKSPNQSSKEKVEALILLINLLLIFPKSEFLNEEISKLAGFQDEIFKVNSVDFFEKTSISSLIFAYNFLLLVNNSFDVEQVLLNILCIYSMEDNDIITCLSVLSSTSERINYKKIPDEIIASLFQLYVTLQRHKERDVKYLATKCLVSLTNSKYQQIVLKQLSSNMDCVIPEMKIAIVQHVQDLNCDSSLKEYIIQKAAIDNNYMVRDFANHCQEK